MNELIMTVGLPRCGKSTWTKSQFAPIVNPDSIRLALHGKRYLASAERQVWDTAFLMVKTLFLTGYKYVILDATNVRKSDRDRWISPDWKRSFVIFDTPKDVCIQRAKDCGYWDLIQVIEEMDAAKTEVADEEGFHYTIPYVKNEVR